MTAKSTQAADLPSSEEENSLVASSETRGQAESSSGPPSQDSTVTAPDYWPRKWLSNAPIPTEPTVVPYPEASASTKSEGWVILELFISVSGRVDKVEVLSASAPDEFIESARQTFLLTPFTPGLKDQTPVPSRIKIEVRYE